MLLMVAALTAINILLIAINASFYFPFSAYLPLLITGVGLSMGTTTALTVCIIISVIITVIYALLWFLSKKKTAFIAVALGLFLIDSGFMLAGIDWANPVSSLVDVLFHVWVISYLIIALVAKKKLKTMPEDEEPKQTVPFHEDYSAVKEPVAASTEQANDEKPELKSAPMYAYEGSGEARIDTSCNGRSIKVMRSFGQTELVIDGQVYDRYERIIEEAYKLGAKVQGDEMIYSQDADGNACLTCNGNEVTNIKVNV